MRFSTTLLAPVLLLLSSANALSTKAQRYDLKASKSADHVLDLNSQEFDDLISREGRDFSVSVLLTALEPGFKCAPCVQFDPAYKAVASSWGRKPKGERAKHIFASVDFKNGQATYKKFGLTSAPTVYFFPAAEGEHAAAKLEPFHYDLNRNGFLPEPLLDFLKPNLPSSLELYKPKPWGLIIFTPISIIAAFSSLYRIRGLILPILKSRIVWAPLTLIAIVVFNSGYMWNRIRDAPYMTRDRQGNSQWMVGGFQQQLGAETQVVGLIYGTLAFAFVALSTMVPTIRDPAKQRAGVFLWSAVLIILFSILMNLFKMKNGSYPFKLLF